MPTNENLNVQLNLNIEGQQIIRSVSRMIMEKEQYVDMQLSKDTLMSYASGMTISKYLQPNSDYEIYAMRKKGDRGRDLVLLDVNADKDYSIKDYSIKELVVFNMEKDLSFAPTVLLFASKQESKNKQTVGKSTKIKINACLFRNEEIQTFQEYLKESKSKI